MRRRDQLAAAAPALRGRRGGRAARAGHRRVHADLPGVGENLQDHLEVYVQHAATQPVTMAPHFRDVRAAEGRARVAAAQERPGRHEPLRGGRLRPLERRRRLPEPDVPLPPDRGPLRRDAARGRRRARLPGPRRPDVLRRARDLQDRLAGPAAQAGAALQLPLDGAGPARVGRGDPRDAADPRRAGVRAVQRRRALARAGRRVRRGDPRLGRARRRDRPAPVVHGEDGHRRRTRSSTRTRCASTGCAGSASSTRRSSRTSRTATSTRRR